MRAATTRRSKLSRQKSVLMTNFTHDVQRRTDRFLHQNINGTWAEVDTNKDGKVDKSEMRGLVRRILTQIKESLPTLVQNAMQPAMENLHSWIESDATGPMSMKHGAGGLRIMQDASIQGRVEAAAQKIASLFGSLLEVLVQHSDELAEEVFDEVDADKDGKVTQQEFFEGFGEAMGHILDFGTIVSELLNDRARRGNYGTRNLYGIGRTTTAVEDPGCGGVMFGVGMFVLIAGLGYQVLAKRMAPLV